MEVIRPFPLDPWQRSLGELFATLDSDMHELHEAGHARLWLFTSVSVRNGLVGTGLVVRVNEVDIASSNRTVGSDDALDAHYAQLGVVLEAVSYIRTMLPRIQMSPWKIHITIVVNNPAVLLSLAKPFLQGGQALITLITEEINQLSEMGAKVNLGPPTEEDNEHTARTHNLAREATVENSEVNPRHGRESSSGRRRCDGHGPMLNSTGRTTSNSRPRANLHASWIQLSRDLTRSRYMIA